MKLSRSLPGGPNGRSAAAFTMVELALCIGIIAFAMVAIMGVLPSGLNVQKQNREDTIIDQEGPQWVNILRDGQVGWDDLTNYVDYILIEHTPVLPVGSAGGTQVYGFRGPYFATNVPNPDVILDSASNIVSLLSIPKYEADQGLVYSNRVTAVFRASSGAQNTQIRPRVIVRSDRKPGPADQQLDDAFRYQMQVEFTPVTTTPTLDLGRNPNTGEFTNALTRENLGMGGVLNALRLNSLNVSFLSESQENVPNRDALTATLYNLRLTFRWPVYKVGNDYLVGSGQRSFRTQVMGRPGFAFQKPNQPNSVYWLNTRLRPRRFDPSTIGRDLSY